jgi:triacylglycerol esterase/lipase EstA (alpha/beta hydrolase family)
VGRRRLAVVWISVLATSALAAQAAGAAYAPPSTPGPPLTVPNRELRDALRCSDKLASATRPPVLLVAGTTLNPQVEFSWNWEPALSSLGWPHCSVTLPNDGMSDIQVAGQYVVYAIRRMHRESGRRVDIVGHSQGGMVPRWALRFWPDTRRMVGDLVGLSPSNHGTVDAVGACTFGCAPSFWQQRTGSNFLRALNSYQETFPGISYSNVYTRTDEVVVPNLGPAASSSLHGGGGQITNVAIQDVCPLDTSEHLAVGTYDNPAYALAIDALTHAGPASPTRVSGSACARAFMPGVDPSTFAVDYGRELAFIAKEIATYPHVSREPPLACYVTASCAGRTAR